MAWLVLGTLIVIFRSCWEDYRDTFAMFFWPQGSKRWQETWERLEMGWDPERPETRFSG